MAVRGPSETLRARAIDGGGPQKLRAEGEGRTHRNVQGRSGMGRDGGDGGDGGRPNAPHSLLVSLPLLQKRAARGDAAGRRRGQPLNQSPLATDLVVGHRLGVARPTWTGSGQPQTPNLPPQTSCSKMTAAAQSWLSAWALALPLWALKSVAITLEKPAVVHSSLYSSPVVIKRV